MGYGNHGHPQKDDPTVWPARIARGEAVRAGAGGKERRCDVENVMSLEGPVLKVNGELMLLIPLEDAGTAVAERSRGISEVQGDFLKIVIPEWLAGMLEIEEGDLVRVDSDGTLDVKLPDPGLVN
jgi:hypothetical protein